MIEFFRDVLAGPLYIIVALLSLVFIMAIIGFIMERKKNEKEEKDRIVYVNNSIDTLTPVETKVEETLPNVDISNDTTIEKNDSNNFTIIQPVEEKTSNNIELNNNEIINNEIPQQPDLSNPALLVKTPVIVFDDPDKKV